MRRVREDASCANKSGPFTLKNIQSHRKDISEDILFQTIDLV